MRIARVEEALFAACEEVRRLGGAIVFNAFEVADAGKVYGVCALGAANLLGTKLDLSKGDKLDAIELGFDGVPFRSARKTADVKLDREFHRIGLRLRARLRPVDAATVGTDGPCYTHPKPQRVTPKPVIRFT